MSDVAEAPRVEVAALDRVQLHAADPGAAAAWYGRVPGLRGLPSSARLDARGIDGRTMATARGQSCATILRGAPRTDGDRTTAFRVPGRRFPSFGARLPDADILARSRAPLERGDAEDHGLAWSCYARDPDGNHLEITTCDHGRVRAELSR